MKYIEDLDEPKLEKKECTYCGTLNYNDRLECEECGCTLQEDY